MSNVAEITDLSVNLMTTRGIIHAVRNVDFTIGEHEVHGLVGESGCGKSMLIKSIMRLHNEKLIEYQGSIKVTGKDVLHMSKKELRSFCGKDVSIIFQDPMTSLNMIMRSGEQISEMLRIKQKLSKSRAKEIVYQIYEKLGITPVQQRYQQYPFEMSGGMIQRVMIALAIACNPLLLIADEPTTALDVTIQAQILKLIKQVQKNNGMSVIIVTHNLGVVAELCDRVSVMYAGRIVESAEVAKLFDEARHPYTIDLLNCNPKSGEKSKYLPSIQGSPPLLYDPPVGCAYAARCQRATKQCYATQPQMEIIEEGHKVACHNWR